MSWVEQVAMWIVLGAIAVITGLLAWARHLLHKRDESIADRLLDSIEKRAHDEIDNLSDDELVRKFNERFRKK